MEDPVMERLATISEALDIMKHVPLIDGHNDWAHLVRAFYDNRIENATFDEQEELVGHVDIQRLLAGRSGAVFLSAYVDCTSPPEHRRGDFSKTATLEPLRETLQQIDLIHRLIERYCSFLELAEHSSSLLEIFGNGKIGCMIGVEGLHQVGDCASVLRIYHKLGVRYVTLTHNWANMYADSATAPVIHGGLSRAGEHMISEMNRTGLLIDLSHASEDAACAVMDLSIAPVAFTHSSTFTLCAHKRNVTDATLRKLQQNGGIIMISFVPAFTHGEATKATIEHVVDHIEHVGTQIGYDHVGIGTDYDGMETAVSGLQDVSKFPYLVSAMLERGLHREDIEKIIGLNIIRVLSSVEAVAKKLKYEDRAPALEDCVKQLWSNELRAYVRTVSSQTR